MADFNPYASQQAAIARQQKMADILQQQAFQPQEAGSYNGIPAALPAWGGLAKALQGYMGGLQAKRAEDKQTALSAKQGVDTTADYADLANALKGGSLDPASFPKYRTAEGRSNAMTLYADQMKAVHTAAAQGNPTAVRVWEYGMTLPEEQRAAFFALQAPSLANVPLGDVRAFRDPISGRITQQFGVGAPPPAAAYSKEQQSTVVLPSVPGTPRPGFAPVPGISLQGQGTAPAAPAAAPSTAPQGTAPAAPAAAPSTAPQGAATGELRPMAPGPVQQQAANKLQTAYTAFESTTARAKATIERAIGLIDKKPLMKGPLGNIIGGPTTGVLGAVMGLLPGTDRVVLNNAVLELKSKNGFAELQKMRDNSPTGGALGQVSDFENKLLQAIDGVLDANDKALPERLKELSALYDTFAAEKKNAFSRDYNTLMGQQALPPAAAAAVPSARITPRAEYDQLPIGARYTGPDGLTYTKGAP